MTSRSRTFTLSPIAPVVPRNTFTAEQWKALWRVRARYPRQADFFAARELAHLRFLRWLYRTGRLHS